MNKKITFKEAGRMGGLKSQEVRKERYKKKKDEYLKNPKRCKLCDKGILFEKRANKFCSKSCSASYNNKGVRRNGDAPSNCINCGDRLESSNAKCCSYECHHAVRWEERKEKIEKTGKEDSVHCAKKYLLETRGHQCEICKGKEWMERPIPLVMDHIDGHSEDNRLDNLRLVCGNCDMQLPTYKSKNKGNGRYERMQRYREGKSH